MRVVLACLLLAVVASATPTPVPYTNCGSASDLLTIQSVLADPFPPVKGQDLTVSVVAQLASAVQEGNYTIAVNFLGIPIFSKSGDICSLDKSHPCPFAQGPYNLSKSVNLPSFVPSGSYDIQITAVSTAPTQAEMTCVKLSVTINSDAKPKALGDAAPAQNPDMVHFINKLKTTWTAGHNPRFDNQTIAHVKHLCGVKAGGPKLPVRRMAPRHLQVPDSFDSRAQWGSICPSTSHIRDQGACGSCWAFGAVESATDRICIHSNGTNTAYLSAEDLLSCCSFSCGMGCDGGYPSAAWDYFQQTGIVTGGDYNSGEGCYPYQVAACEHHVSGPLPACGDEGPTPTCTQTCQNGATWSSDKHFGASSYSVNSDQLSIQQEIMTNGPVEGAFTVYEDFVSYKSGVYQHVTGAELGGHAISIIGWGTDNGTPYWIVKNSWNTAWGNKGYFNILRGSDECGIEDQIVAGIPQ